jgi:hypothetical protein
VSDGRGDKKMGEDADKGVDEEKTLVFVYNADSGVFHELKDYVHKAVSPSTYGCNLCAITFGSLGMKKDWKNFVDGLDLPVEFLHRDEFADRYPLIDVQFPAAFVKRGSDIKLLIAHTEINRAKSVEDLVQLVTAKVKELRE